MRRFILAIAMATVAAISMGASTTIWSGLAVSTSTQYTSSTVVQPTYETKDVLVYTTLNKGTATSVTLTPMVNDGSGNYYPYSTSAVSLTTDSFNVFDDAIFETGLPVKFAVLGVGDCETTAPLLTIKAKLR